MRALRVVGLDEGGKYVVCEETVGGERFRLPADERLRAAARGDVTRLGQMAIELESQMRPREIQSRIRAGESVEQVAAAANLPAQRVERFAYPVLLERSRTAELAQRAHPVREDGPDVQTLTEVAAHAFSLRGHDYATASWDSWRGDDGRWVVQLRWRAGRSDNRAHWSFAPGAHGGTVVALDDNAMDIMDPTASRPLRTVRPAIPMMSTTEEPRTPARAEPRVPDYAQDQPAPEPADADEDYPAESADYADEPEPADEPAAAPVVEATGTDRGTLSAPAYQPPAAPPLTPPPAQPRPEPARPAEPDMPAARQAPAPQAPARPAAQTPAAPARQAPTHQTPAHQTPARPAQQAPRKRNARPAMPGIGERDTPRAPAARAPQQATEQRPAEPAQPVQQQEPPQPEPAQPEKPAAKAPAKEAPKRGKKGRPNVPSWEDVLLGVRSNRN